MIKEGQRYLRTGLDFLCVVEILEITKVKSKTAIAKCVVKVSNAPKTIYPYQIGTKYEFHEFPSILDENICWKLLLGQDKSND